jgi:hypothetical protein
VETFYYFIFGMFGCVGLGCVAAVLVLPCVFVLGRRALWRFGSRMWTLMVAVTAFGLPGHLAFALFKRGRAYQLGDPILDFSPFVLPGTWLVKGDAGDRWLAGATAQSLYPLWALFAVLAWVGGGFTWRAFWRREVSSGDGLNQQIKVAFGGVLVAWALIFGAPIAYGLIVVFTTNDPVANVFLLVQVGFAVAAAWLGVATVTSGLRQPNALR